VPSAVNDALTDLLRDGARQMLALAVEAEVQEFLARYQALRDDQGRRRLVRNGYLPGRTIQTGLGDIEVKAPRVRDRAEEVSFIINHEAKYPKAVACLNRDRDALLAFYDFPAEHWVHIRTTNPIESTFTTVRLRTAKTRGCVSRQNMLAKRPTISCKKLFVPINA
jgi:transposase-like protein